VLHVTTWNATYVPMMGRGPSVATREYQWRQAFAEPDRRWFCLVVENSQGALVGFAKGRPSDHPEYEGELNKIYLLREYHRLGLDAGWSARRPPVSRTGGDLDVVVRRARNPSPFPHEARRGENGRQP
jgi:hypothetical protein